MAHAMSDWKGERRNQGFVEPLGVLLFLEALGGYWEVIGKS
jgi:hypothetical protein